MGFPRFCRKVFKMESYRHLRLEDRRTVFQLVEAGWPVSEIAAHLQRHPSTIYRELRRNRNHDEHPPFRGYFPTVAQGKAAARRARGAKVARDPRLAAYIVDRLAAAWSPEQIAGYVRRHRLAGLSISHMWTAPSCKGFERIF
jgi:IS30 family transposase